MRQVFAADSGADALSALIDYAFRVREVLDPGTVIDIMQTHLGRPGKEVVMTAADRLIEMGRAEAMTAAERMMEQGHARGLAEGKAEGKAEGQAEVLAKLIQLRFGPPDASLLARLAGASGVQLDALAEAILNAPDLADLLQVLDAEPSR